MSVRAKPFAGFDTVVVMTQARKPMWLGR
jgi:hypothetical protein